MTESLPRAARVATFAYFTINGFVIGLWVVHIPVVEESTGIAHSTLGLLLLVLGAAAFAGMQLAGPLVDRVGQRRLLPASGVLLGVVAVGPGLADSWWTLGIALALLGFGNGTIDVAMNSHAVVVERRYPRPIMSAFHAMWSIGGAVAALVGAGALNAEVPTAVTLGAAGVLCVLVSVLVARFLVEDGGVVEEPVEDEAPAARPRRLVWLLGAIAFAFMLAEGAANDWAALHSEDVLGTSASVAAFAYGSFAVAMTVGRFATDRVAALAGPVAVVRYGALLAAVGVGLVMVSPWVWLALVGWALFGLGLSGGVPQLFTAAGNLDPRASGALMARVVGLGYVGLLAGPAVVGGLTHWVSLSVAFAVPLLLCVFAAAFAHVLAPRRVERPLVEAER